MNKLTITMDASAAYVEIFDAYLAYFAKNGLEIEVLHLSPANTALNYFLDGKADLFWGGPLNYAIINHHLDGKQLAPLAEDTDIDCHSVFITRSDSPIQSIEDLRGKTISTGPKYSAESRIIPAQYLREAGLEINKDYQEVNFPTQNEGIRAMYERQIDCAVSFYRNFLKELAFGVYMDWELKVIGRTPVWDHCIFLGQPNLDKEKSEDYHKLIDLMLKMDKDDPLVAKEMRMEGVNKWVKGRPDRYQLLLDGADYLNIYEAYNQEILKR